MANSASEISLFHFWTGEVTYMVKYRTHYKTPVYLDQLTLSDLEHTVSDIHNDY